MEPGPAANPGDIAGVTPLTERSDAALLTALRAGDDAAYEELVRTYAPRLLPVARRIVGSEHDAYDALQDGFLSAFKAIDRFEGASALGTWLHRIVVNASLMKLRASRRRPEVSIDDLLPRFREDGHRVDAVAAWSVEDEDPLVRRELRERVLAKIDELPDDYRTVLILRDIEGFDTRQTAEQLEIREPAVKTRLHRARQALRTLLEKELA